MLSLDELLEHAHAHARRTLIGSATEQIVPLFHIQFKNRPPTIMAAPWADGRQKGAFIHALRTALKQCRATVVNYSFVSEAWVAEQSHPLRDSDLMPSKRENRRECVVVSVGDHEGGRMKMWEIVRDGEGRVTDLVEEKAAPSKGRLFNLLCDDED